MAQLGCFTPRCCVNDAVCCDLVDISAANRFIWEDRGNFSINSTIVLENRGPNNLRLILNNTGAPVLTVPPNQCASITVNNVSAIQVDADGGTDARANGKITFSLNYKF